MSGQRLYEEGEGGRPCDRHLNDKTTNQTNDGPEGKGKGNGTQPANLRGDPKRTKTGVASLSL
ncbi:hypothetical protein M378DRAFT_18232 [Amanita muscaria Koide BX008]|uniref:Uncharacterized protein n=1 Tax=Amanita muscaria (strain Koide BX008) TaxID=946122 RepID=A0A0C2SMD3_AMAMK|nr:hypothetical protein M378DRAFT_18232 [Amanita muscaria Koide BX008]